MNAATKKWTLFLLTLALIAGAAGILARVKHHQRLGQPGLKTAAIPGEPVMVRLELPERVLDFTSTNIPTQERVLGYLPKDTSYAQRHYLAPDGASAQANLILMGMDRTSIHRPDFCIPGQGWQITERTPLKLPIAGPHPYELPVMKWTIHQVYTAPDGTRHPLSGLYVFWFVTENQATADFADMQWSMFFHLLGRGELQRWAYVSYFTVCAPGQEEQMFERVKQLIIASVPEFQNPLPPPSRADFPSAFPPAVPGK